MDFTEYLQQVCDAVAHFTRARRGVTPERFLCAGKGSLGITGDDAAELLTHLGDRFGASFEHFPYDRYFGPEAGFEPISYLWLRLIGRYKPLKTITVEELARYMWAQQPFSSPTPAHCRCIVPLLTARDGQRTRVELSSRRSLEVFNIAWGDDIGDDYGHITSNISPRVDGSTSDLFFTDEVIRIVDPSIGAILWETDGRPNVR